MTDYRPMLEEIGINMEANENLMKVMPAVFKDIISSQQNRPSGMTYFDSALSAIRGSRVEELLELKKRGGKVIGVFCTYVPEEIILALGGACVGLCSGSEVFTGEVEKVLPRNLCALIKSSFGFKVGKLCPVMEVCDLLIGETTCDGKKKFFEILNEYTPTYVMELPQKKRERDVKFWREEVRSFASRIEELTGRKLTVGKLKDAIRIVNEKRKALLRLAEIRKSKTPVISGKDALLISQVAFYDDPVRFADKLNDLCDELDQRMDNKNAVFPEERPRILLSGCPMAVPNWKIPHIVEKSGGVIVMEELCTGIRYYRNLVDDNAGDLSSLFDNIADRYMGIDCAVFTPNWERLQNVRELVKDYRIDGVIYYALQFCDPYTIEAYNVRNILSEEGTPLLYIETDYSKEDVAQISTRVEAFLEVLRENKSGLETRTK